jgi:hypothetical protein
MKIIEALKKKTFWVNLIVFLGFILPLSLTIIGAIGHGLLHIDFFEGFILFHWFILFGIFYGIPLIILIYIIFYFIEKKNNALTSSPEKITVENKTAAKIPFEVKLLIGFLVWAFLGSALESFADNSLFIIIYYALPFLALIAFYIKKKYKKNHSVDDNNQQGNKNKIPFGLKFLVGFLVLSFFLAPIIKKTIYFVIDFF